MAMTYQELISAPRPQAGIPSPDGSRIINIVDQWDEERQELIRKIFLIPLSLPDKRDMTGPQDVSSCSMPKPTLLFTCTSNEAKSFFWLSEINIAYFSGSTIKYINLPTSEKLSQFDGGSIAHKDLLTFPKAINASFLAFEQQTGLLAFRAQVWETQGDFEGTKEDQNNSQEKGSGVRYDELFVRYKDKWRIPGKVYTIGLVRLIREGEVRSLGEIDGQKYRNVLKGTGLYSQIPSFSSNTISLNRSHLIIATKPPRLSPAIHTRMDIYAFPLNTDQNSPCTGLPINLTPGHNHGEIDYVSSSGDGQKIVWTEREIDGDEASKRSVFTWDFTEGMKTKWVEKWDASPSEVQFFKDRNSLYWLSETKGRILPYFIPGPNSEPIALHHQGVTDSLTPLNDHTVLISKSDMFNPIHDYILYLPSDIASEPGRRVGMVQLTDWSSGFLGDKLDDLKLEEYWFKGVDERQVMGWTAKPRGFDEAREAKKVFPMVSPRLLGIFPWTLAKDVAHRVDLSGGPQSACRDIWLIRWNLLLYASYGYFVLSINPTGSIGYGQEFVDRLRYEFGGRDVDDLEEGYKAVLADYPQIDPERTAALGPSSGGQLIHRINGCNDRFAFKALVCHAGIYDETSMAYETDELWLSCWNDGINPNTDQFQGGKYNPINNVNRWKTPTLIIHGAKDFRVPLSQAIGAFTALQWRGVPSRFLHLPDEGHKFERPNNVKQWYAEIFTFLDEWIGH
ncbi:uncharacterized protein L199_005576 [Kwoniella botswanensis]|uniref:uncharacterized protein n=1 Tax=Kwoniella botswanensis TaxID=1268659 RepID=UPI00315C9027